MTKKANWSSFTKAELVQACCTLEAQKAKLLKRVAKLERDTGDLKSGARLDALRIDKALQHPYDAELSPREQAALRDADVIFPWEKK